LRNVSSGAHSHDRLAVVGTQAQTSDNADRHQTPQLVALDADGILIFAGQPF
jgi:hypothetical protein